MRDALHAISVALLLGASVWVAYERRRPSPWRLACEVMAGAAVGGIPAALLIESSKHFRPDWALMCLMVGFIVGTVNGAAGSSAAAWLLAPPRGSRGASFGSALIGALLGCSLAYYAVKAYEHGIDVRISPLLIAMAALLVGSFATLGGRLGGQPR